MDQLTAVKTLNSALDEYARGAVSSYDACEKAGRSNCDDQFEKNMKNVKRGRQTAVRLRDAIKSFYVCQRSSSDPSVCSSGVKNSVRDIAASTAPREESASLPKTAMEMSNAAGTAPSASKIIQQNDMQPEQVVPPQSANFDPSTVYAQLPRSNPLARIPLRDLVGRSMNDHVKNPFKLDIRPPVFPTLKPNMFLGVPEDRVYQIESLKKQYRALNSGIGYSGRSDVYCNQSLS